MQAIDRAYCMMQTEQVSRVDPEVACQPNFDILVRTSVRKPRFNSKIALGASLHTHSVLLDMGNKYADQPSWL